MQSENKITLASAGSGKTAEIVNEAIRQKDKRVLITTYTRENLSQIISAIIHRCGYVPNHISVLTWLSFLLQECVRPYQKFCIGDRKIHSTIFVSPPERVKKTNLNYFFTRKLDIYSERLSDFAYMCNDASKGLVIDRLECIYDYVFIDEIQDLAGWDLDFVELLLDSSIVVSMVGDPRQTTYRTTRSPKNKDKSGPNLPKWTGEIENKKKCIVQNRFESFRCNQIICDFADDLFPDYPKTTSRNTETTPHDGIFTINREDVSQYVTDHSPKILRWDKTVDTMGLPAMNFGVAKGSNFDRVLIFPTNPMKKYLDHRDASKLKAKEKFYVAVTRARYSVAFVMD